MTRTQIAPLAALMLAALLLAGCGGGGGGGEPTVTQTIHDELQAELDAALATLARERAAKMAAEEARAAAVTARQAADDLRAAAETERDTAKAAQLAAEAAKMEAEAAQAEAEADEAEAVAARMAAETQLATALKDKEAVEADRDAKRNEATAAAVELINVKAARDAAQLRVTELEGQLETANGRVTDLTGERDTANTEIARLEGELEAAQGEAMRLAGVIGDATDAANAAESASLHAQLNAAKAEVTRLTARVGSETDASSLTGMLETAKADVTRLTGELRTAQADVTRLTNQIGTAGDATSLTGMLDAEKVKVRTLEGEKRLLESEVASLKSQLATARGERDTAQDRADDAEDRAREATQQAQGLDANARANALWDRLTGEGGDGVGAALHGVTTEIKNRSLTLKASGFTGGTSTTGRFRRATFTKTSAVTQGSEKMIAYTDRETRRPFNRQFSAVGSDTPDNTNDDEAYQRKPVYVLDVGLLGVAATGDLLAEAAFVTSLSHGLSPTSTGTDDVIGTPKTTIPATVRGVGGRFVCVDTTACTITPTGSYTTVGTTNRLTGVTIAATSGTLYFQPTSDTTYVSLLDDVGLNDEEFMIFGWRRTIPNRATGPVMADVFTVAATSLFSGDVTGTYEGPAVGLYAERQQAQFYAGEFTATAYLEATGSAVAGSIRDFRTDHGSKDWNVELDSQSITSGAVRAAADTASLDELGANTTGSWEASFSDRHGGSGIEDNPIAVVGKFDAQITDRLYINGAFGAHRK